MDLGIAGRGFVVFGGTRGMGLAAARALAADGAAVAVVGRDEGRARTAADELATGAAPVVGIAADLTQPDAAEQAIESAIAALGAVHGMAITTGMGARGQVSLLSSDDDAWQHTFDDILLAIVRACRATVSRLVESGGGAIVTTAAYSIRAPKPHQAPYAALKASVCVLTKNIAKTYGGQGVRANCVCPGAVETDVLAFMRKHIAAERGWPEEEALERVMREDWHMDVALGRAGKPQELGDVIAFLLSDRASYLTGATINVDGGTDF